MLLIHPFNGPLSGTTQMSRYQKGKTNLDFTEARDNEWQWHQLGHMQVCTWLQTDNHTSTPPLSFLQAGCPSCRPTNSVKALKAEIDRITLLLSLIFTFCPLPSYGVAVLCEHLSTDLVTGDGREDALIRPGNRLSATI